ncbi:MAG: hypothetical protein R3335_14205, partial [Anaerolineales bacterium]|nr:hypothetical protein [Anaerolineales bacterium]
HATTYILPCSTPDSYEPDNSAASPTAIALGVHLQSHNFCQPGDQDWVQFSAQAGVHYRVYALPIAPSTAAAIEIYAADGTTLLSGGAAHSFGGLASAGWTATSNQPYLIKVSHIDSAVAGDAVSYLLWIDEGFELTLPSVMQVPPP